LFLGSRASYWKDARASHQRRSRSRHHSQQGLKRDAAVSECLIFGRVTTDATAFPPGSAMVHGGTAIGAMWKSMAEQVSDPKVVTLDVKPLHPSAAREIGTFSLKTKGPTPQEVTGKYVVVWEKVGNDWKLAADIWNDGR
jgi:ketosteroid isomerase-like protein